MQANETLGKHWSCADVAFANGRQCACMCTEGLPHSGRADLPEAKLRPAELPGWPGERIVHVWVWAGARPEFLRVGGG